MKFKSRKDILMKAITFGTSIFLLVILFIRILAEGYSQLGFVFLDLVILATIGLLVWIYVGTAYELTSTELKYKSGPLSGVVKIERITEIIVGGTLWSGVKPATALKGLLIKFGKYDEIYISPETNATFVEKIKTLNKNIKITEKK
jgi:hypothetical protein